jgi:molybdenum cofactor cytidylyltransferase
MGQFKLLLPWLDDQPILAHIVAKLAQLPLNPLIIVTGHRANDVHTALTDFDVQFVHNPDYAQGELLSSLKTGLRAMPDAVDAALVIPGDLPRVPAAIMQMVLNGYQPGVIVAPRHAGQRGHPVLFDKRYWQAILDLPPHGAPRDVVRRNQDNAVLVDVDSDGILADIDTQEAYERELQRAREEQRSR